VPCPDCGMYGESPDPGLSRWQCGNCGHGYFLRRCSACARVSYVDGLQGFRQPWLCTWCGQANTGFSQNRDPAAASVAELAADVARHGSPLTAAGPEAGDQAAGRPGAASPGSPPSGQPGAAPRPRRKLRRAAVAAAMVAIAAAILVAATGAGMPRVPAGAASGHGSAARVVRVTASAVGTVNLQGVAGQLSIAGTVADQVLLTGQLHWVGKAPVVVTRLDRAAGVLWVSVRCAPASPCTQNFQLAVPAHTAATIHQAAGHVVVTGLASPLSISAANVDVSAAGLSSPVLTAMITSGHLTATFTVPPRQVVIALASAQATIRLPARAAYRIIQQVTSGYIRVGIPQAGSATRTVTARLDSGELELLPS
jgi:hypothetical protein